MENKNKSGKYQDKRRCVKILILALIVSGLTGMNVHAQTRFTRSTFNAAFVPITLGGGATSSTATGDNANQASIPIGFSFGYGDSTFTVLGINTNGFIWFDAVAPAVATGNTNMVTTSSPNQCMSAWWNNLIDDASSDILYQTQGAPGSRTFTIQFTNYPTYIGTPGSDVRMNNQIILYETTNVIEFSYGSLNIIGGQTTSGGAMIGLEWGTGGNGKFIDAVTGSSIVNHRMLSPLSGWPSYNFRFTPGIPSPIAAGSYNVGVGQTYNSITQAVADVNHKGITGAVTLNLTDAQYDTTVANGSNIFPIFVATPNGSATNLLTISKTGAPATLAYRGSSIAASGAGWGTSVGTTVIGHSSEPLLGVCASYTTISNLNLITHGAPQTVEIGLAVFELFGAVGAQHNMFDKISVDLDRTHGGVYGIYSFSTTSPGGVAGTNSYNTFRDLNIKDCNVGFNLSGVNNATGQADYGNQIITSSCNTYNYIGDPNVPDDILNGGDAYGINVNGQNGFIVRNCIIQNITSTTTTGDVDGISVTNSFGNNEISNNIIRTVRRSNVALNSAHWVSGIRINWDNQTMNFKIFNNSISNLLTSYTGAVTAQAAILGIYFQDTGAGTVTSEIYNNSISLNGSTFPNASSICMSINATSKSFQIKNNVFANFTGAQTGAAYHSIFYTNSVNFYGNTSSMSNYNNYYLANPANAFIGQATSSFYTTVAAWQAAMTLNPGTDTNSQVANPNFVNNATNLHATGTSTSLDGTGTPPPAYVTVDIDCQTRNAPHDIGFDDFTISCIPPVPVISGSTSFCSGSSTILDAGAGYSLYSWSTGATTQTISVNTATTVTVTVTDGNGCTGSDSKTTTVNANPTPVITGSTSFCSGGSTVLDAGAGYASYSWSTGATTQMINVNTATTVTVTVTNANGCTGSDSKTTTIGTALTPNIAGNLFFCSGSSTTLDAGGGYAGYSWSTGATTQTIIVNTATTVTVTVTDGNGCTGSDSKTTTINATPTASISGNDNICLGENGNVQLAFTGTGPWNGTVSDGSNTVNFGPVNASTTVTVSPSSGGLHNYTITSLSDANCTGSGSGTAAILVSTAPPINTIHFTAATSDGCVGAPAAVCSVNSVANCTFYSWNSDQAGARFDGNPGPYQTTNPTVNVTFVSLPAAGASGWSICVAGGNGCGNTNTICTWVRATLSTPGSLNGSIIGCPGSTLNPYSSASVSGAASYQWSSTGGITITGNGAQSVTVDFSAGFVSGTLSVHGQTSCGYNGPNRTITITRAPSIPGIITGSSYPCPNTSSAYSIAPVNGAADYTWTTSVPGAIVTGTTTSCSILFPGIIPAGSIVSVTANSSCPFSSPVRSKGIANGTPGVPSNISGPASGQCGETGVSYSITPVALATGYNWTTTCGTIQGPNNLSGVTIDWPGSFTFCTISVTATNACGAGIARSLNVLAFPATPASVSGNAVPCAGATEVYSASSSGAASYNWTVPAGSVILGPTNGASIILQWGSTSGNVSAQAVNACGNSGFRSLACVISCRQSQVNASVSGFDVEVYPNPASEKTTVKFMTSTSSHYLISMLDISGRQVMTGEGKTIEGVNIIDLDLVTFAKGVYTLNLSLEEGTTTIKVVIN